MEATEEGTEVTEEGIEDMENDLLMLSLQLYPSQKLMLKLTMVDMEGMVDTEVMVDMVAMEDMVDMVDTEDIVDTVVVTMAKDLLTLSLQL